MTYLPSEYVATAGQRDFTVPFPFISRSHVEVLVNGVPTTVLEWPNASIVRLASALAGGESVVIRRVTPIDQALVKFQDGAILTQEDLNLAVEQLLYKQQEVTALYEGSLAVARARLAENLGIVTDPTTVAQELAELVLEQQVLDEFRQRVADIDLNAEAITSQALSLASTDDRVSLLRTDHDTLVGLVDALSGGDPGTGIATLIQDETNARIAGDTAITQTLALIGAKSADGLAFILDLAKTKVSPTETLASRFSALAASDSSNLALIQSNDTARINGDNALASSINSLGARVTTAEAGIVSEQNARVAGDNAEATARQALAARVTAAEAAITTEQTARANADSAFTQTLALLGAKNAGGTAWLLDLNTVQVSAGVTMGTRLSGIDTQIANNAASIISEQTARANADSALSQQITTLTTTVNGNTASVSTLQSSVNGLQARYGVSLDVNGYVTGFVQNNNGASGSFTIIADKFAIVTPGSAPTVPFEVSGGVVRIKEAAIGTLSVTKLTGGSLGAAITQNADWTVGTGRIIWDNGTYMKVSGVGFGTSSQFIEWFGPKMAISACSEANAISYLKTNGSAYFGGSLSGGVLRNSGQTSDIGSAATITVGPFGSNGRPIQVVTSYSCTSSSTSSYDGTAAGRTAWDNAVTAWGATAVNNAVDASKAVSCNVVVQITRNGVAFATLTITSGSESIIGQRPVPSAGEAGYLTITRTITGSITSTDNAGGTSNRTFTATITDRTNAVYGAVTQQRVGIISTEE